MGDTERAASALNQAEGVRKLASLALCEDEELRVAACNAVARLASRSTAPVSPDRLAPGCDGQATACLCVGVLLTHDLPG